MHLSRRILVVSAVLTALPALYAQRNTNPSKLFTKRFSFGARISYLQQGLLKEQAPVYPITGAYTSASKKFGYGATVDVSFSKRFGMSADLIYRRIGYLVTWEDLLGSYSDVTKANFFDLPVLFRYQYFGSTGARSHLYVNAGVAVRRMRNAVTTRDYALDSDGSTTTTRFPPVGGRNSVRGYVAGVGLRFKDDVGIKVSPEFRYTYWMGSSVNASPVLSRRSQLEAIVGITW